MKWLITFLCFAFITVGHSQELPAFKPLRYDEDYSILKNDTNRTFHRRLKYISIAPDRNSYISIGGEARLQYLSFSHQQWSDAPEANHSEILNRYLLHTDIHPGKHFRTFVELQSSLAYLMKDASPVDDNSLELHQGFVELRNYSRNNHIAIRVGRQELQYGTQRLVSAREGPNNRHSFDGIKLILKKQRFTTDIFYSQYVLSRKGFLNDRFSGDTKFWGVYLVGNKIELIQNFDLYYLGLAKRRSAFDDGTGKEIRHTIGTRCWESAGNWKYDFETVYQFGKFDGGKIQAWTASINTSYTFSNHPLKPGIGLKAEIISGDKAYDDHSLQTFNPLFPRGGYFGLAALIGPENLVGVHPSVAISPLKGMGLSFDYDMLWRHSTRDGIYAPSNRLIFSGRETTRKYIGNQYSFSADYSLNRFVSFALNLVCFDARDYLEEVSAGKTVFFIGLTTKIKF